MEILKKRKGSIKLSRSLLDSAPLNVIKMLFSNFYTVSINNDNFYMNGTIMYYGFSEHFEEVEEATIPPEYEVIFNSEDDEIKSIEFKKL